jgi:UDP-N-acetylmuramate dehydrogenase
VSDRDARFEEIEGLDVERDVPMSGWTTFRVGGPVSYFLTPSTPDALRATLRRAREAGVPVYVLGGGTNLLVADEGWSGAIIRVERNIAAVSIEDDEIVVAAGARMPALAALAARAGLSGLEYLAGIPGTVGGALGINAGAFGREFGAYVRHVDGFDYAGEPRRFDASEVRYGYRLAEYPEPIVFTGARLRLERDDPAAIGRRAAEIRAKRQESQPTRSKSAGCAFKNPTGDSAGRLIDASGLKGFAVGAAQVSTIHANYLVNRGAATAAEIRALIRDVQARVLDACGVRLETEVCMLGMDP